MLSPSTEPDGEKSGRSVSTDGAARGLLRLSTKKITAWVLANQKEARERTLLALELAEMADKRAAAAHARAASRDKELVLERARAEEATDRAYRIAAEVRREQDRAEKERARADRAEADCASERARAEAERARADRAEADLDRERDRTEAERTRAEVECRRANQLEAELRALRA